MNFKANGKLTVEERIAILADELSGLVVAGRMTEAQAVQVAAMAVPMKNVATVNPAARVQSPMMAA